MGKDPAAFVPDAPLLGALYDSYYIYHLPDWAFKAISLYDQSFLRAAPWKMRVYRGKDFEKNRFKINFW